MTIAKDYAAAMAAYRSAKAVEDAFVQSVWNPAFEREKLSAERNGGRAADGDLIADGLNDAIERLMDVRCDAEDALIGTPAPTLNDVIWKIGFARVRWADACDWPAPWWDAVMADLRRFADARPAGNFFFERLLLGAAKGLRAPHGAAA